MGACCSTPSLPEAADSGVNDASQLEDKKQQALFQHHSNSNPSGSLKQYTTRTTLSFEPTKTEECSCGGSALATPNMDNIMVEASVESLTPSFPQIDDNKSELTDFQLKMEMKKLEKLESRRRLEELQMHAFDQQVKAMQSKQYQRLYDVFKEYSKDADVDTMDVDGLTSALKVFGMIIDTNTSFQSYIWSKFDLENEAEIRFDDFSSTLASLLNLDDDSLQTLFEIFDIDEDGFLRLEDFARIFLSLNHISVVSTGSTQNVVYSKKQCRKQARKIIAECDCQSGDGRISFKQFLLCMEHLKKETQESMMIQHMTAPSISTNGTSMMSIPGASMISIPGIRSILPANSMSPASSLEVAPRR